MAAVKASKYAQHWLTSDIKKAMNDFRNYLNQVSPVTNVSRLGDVSRFFKKPSEKKPSDITNFFRQSGPPAKRPRSPGACEENALVVD